MTLTLALLLGGYLGLLLLGLRLRGRSLEGPWAVLLRSFLPSWQFFDRLGNRPLLQVRLCGGGPAQHREACSRGYTTWAPRARCRLLGILHSPFTLGQLYQQTLVEQLAGELRRHDLSPEELARGSAYRSVLALSAALADAEQPGWTALEFRILLINPRVDASLPHDDLSENDERLILLSPTIESAALLPPLRCA